MATIKEFKEWLNRFPDDTIVLLAFQQKSYSWAHFGPIDFITPTLKDLDYGEGWSYTDFTDNPFVKETDSHFQKKFLELGEPF